MPKILKTQTIVIESNCTIMNYQATFHYICEMILESVNWISEWKQLNDVVSHIHCNVWVYFFILLKLKLSIF